MSDLQVAICRRAENLHLLPDVHRLRARVFRGRLDWSVVTCADMEIDNFDVFDPIHLVVITPKQQVLACARMLPTTGPYMVRDNFSQLLGPHRAPEADEIWECSRFAVDTANAAHVTKGGVRTATSVLLAGMLEWAIALDIDLIVAATDTSMERVLARAGWPMHRLAEPQLIETCKAVAGTFRVDADTLAEVRQRGALSEAVLQSQKAGKLAA